MQAILKRKTALVDSSGQPLEKPSPKEDKYEKIRAPSIMSNKNGPDNQADVPL